MPIAAPAGSASASTVASATVGSTSTVSRSDPNQPLQREQLLYILNAERDRHGLHPLTLSTGVENVAREWSAHLSRQGHLEHRPDLAAALEREGVTGWHTAGENVGYGPHVAEVHREFMSSTGHRANILSPAYSEVGIGVTAVNGRVWVTVNFVGR